MKTLIISGSPRKNGDSAALVRELADHLEGEKIFVHTYFDDIHPCNDCRYCWQNDGCCIQDGMQKVYALMNEADAVVLASPLYFSELTGSLLSFASRFQCYYAARRIRKDPDFALKKKHGVLILTGGGDGIPEPAIERAGILFRMMNAECIGTVLSLKTDKLPAREDSEALAKARELAGRLNELGG